MFEFLKIFFTSLFPDYGSLRKRGFETKIFNADLVLCKEYKNFTFNLHQAVEPHNSRFGHLMDFKINGVCFILQWPGESLDKARAKEFCLQNFDQVYHREDYIFCELKKMKWEDPRVSQKAMALDDFLSSDFS